MSQESLYNHENTLPEVTPIEELEAAVEAGTLPEPERTLGTALEEASGPMIEAAMDTVVEAAAAEGMDSGAGAEGAVPLAQVLSGDTPAEREFEITKTPIAIHHNGGIIVGTFLDRAKPISFKLVGSHVSEDDAKAAVASLPEGSFYKKNPLDARAAYRVYERV